MAERQEVVVVVIKVSVVETIIIVQLISLAVHKRTSMGRRDTRHGSGMMI